VAVTKNATFTDTWVGH